MTANTLDRLENYILKRINKIAANETKTTGAAVLKLKTTKNWPDNLSDLLQGSLYALQTRFLKSTKENEIKLTEGSAAIGKSILGYNPKESNETQIIIGDFFLEAFYNKGYILLDQPKGKTTQHTINWTIKGTALFEDYVFKKRPLLRGSGPYKPEPTTKMVREYDGYVGPAIKRKNKFNKGDTDQPFVIALDKQQQQAWKINTPVLEALLKEENNKLFFKETPTTTDQLKSLDSRKFAHSITLSKAKELNKYAQFYQMYDMDYRGRYYPIESFMNFQSADEARGIMLFAEGKKLTPRGVGWLYIHAANSFNESYHIDDLPEWCEPEKYRANLLKREIDTISVDKMKLEDRILWTEYNLDMIYEHGKEVKLCVNSKGKLAAEKPTTFLSCCVEIKSYLDDNSFKSRLPIPVDGQNNGWQHLCAQALDENTAALVGMKDTEFTEDFYLVTGKRMMELISNSRKLEDQKLYKKLESMPMKDIRKGISKRGSMTKAYSAGAGAIGENMWEDCKQARFNIKYDITEPDCYKSAKFLVKAIVDVCPGPLDTMKYFQDLAKYELGSFSYQDAAGNCMKERRVKLKKIVKELNSFNYNLRDEDGNIVRPKRQLTEDELKQLNDCVKEIKSWVSILEYGVGKNQLKWTTPSGFKVDYENYISYKSDVFGTIKGYMKSGGVRHVIHKDTNNPSRQDFAAGISPNIVHSMDASHMALVCANWDGCFAGVHDSYSTHASDVDDLIDLIKDEFIEIYKDGKFYQYIKDEIIGDQKNLPEGIKPFDEKLIPATGQYDLKELHKSNYFFS